MFEFVTTYVPFLKHIPGFPHVFEAMLKIELFIRNRELLTDIDDLENEVLNWKGVTSNLHKFGGIQFNVRAKEIGHLHGNGMVDILFNKKTRHQLLQTGWAREHHTFKNSGWISFLIKNKNDKAIALALLQQAYQLKLNNH